ncbi:hypothetical protein [Paenibacillus sp. PL2-23]|uniref:hypothetical protein n=1 Tax=Paenibacillus sp. PL2-23 TaxID=2100729 RepID=UPI0030F53574
MGWNRRRLVAMLAAAWLTMAGCAGAASKLAPEEWLRLSYAGLAGMDQYSFAGAMSIGMAGGPPLKPQLFEGKVVDHHQLTIQSDIQDSLYWNPVQVLETLSRSYERVAMLPATEAGAGSADTVTIRVKEKPVESKNRWEKALREELEQVASDAALAADDAYTSERQALLVQASKELSLMLSSLEVETEYDIVIDRRLMLPLKMEENTVFTYDRNEERKRESRHTTVRFEAFNGASTVTEEVQ